jgi:hypothetical protein
MSSFFDSHPTVVTGKQFPTTTTNTRRRKNKKNVGGRQTQGIGTVQNPV